jgi:DMSO reductase anchor subunit
LLSSTAHLGRPERAWHAFSQWRSSWLSREGVLVERWLFFAEAKHTVTLYYGASAA